MNAIPKPVHCKAQTKAGKPCRAAATEGGLCFFHANPNKASELGRIGGRKNRHGVADPLDPLPRLDTAIAVRTTVARLIEDVYAGKLHPRIASGLAPLLSLQLRAIERSDLGQRVAKLEKLLASPDLKGNFDGGEQPIDFGNLPNAGYYATSKV
ncbi:MAG: hypothetical protein JWN45_2509 [Acidobacteriaceae bacterium]|nr:hypothetical protein [Acidobacteriaceae bacterium]